MFEIVGKSPRPTKHINVTEARATFASMLADLESHYVITKNNKPKRVIINFDEYQQWLRLLEVAASAGGGNKETQLQAKTPADAPTDLLRRTTGHDHEVNGEAVVPTRIAPAPSDEAHGIVMTPPAISPTAVETDYFNSTAGEDLSAEVERLLPEPEDESAPLAQPDDNGWARQDTVLQYDSACAQTPEIKTTDAKSTDFIDHVAKTPEEEEYYRRYRKLYESFYTSSTATISTETDSFSPLENTTEKSLASTKIAEHFGQDAKHDGNILDSKQENENVQTCADSEGDTLADEEDVQNNDGRDSTTGVDSLAEPQQNITPVQKEVQTSAHESTSQSRQEPITEALESKGEKLPSLQELLKDLETQRLSAEDGEPLKTEDIDEIINRITSD